MSDVFALVLLPHLKVQNANAISGPLTWGFPSPTAFAGFVHALERKFLAELNEGFTGVGIICHYFEPQVSSPSRSHIPHVFSLTRNPVGKDGGTMAFVEEGRAHMEVSLVIAVRDYKSEGDGKDLAERLEVKNAKVMWPVRIAVSGRAVTPGGAVEICRILGRDETLRRIDAGIAKLEG